MNTDAKYQINYPLARDKVVQLLQQYGITPTRQRIAIATFMFQCAQHLSADRILDGVNTMGYRVSRATVYNTMALFTEKGLLKEVLIDRDRVFYDSNNRDHHHIYNVDSGELKDVNKIGVELMGLPEMDDGINIVGTDVIIRVSAR